MRASARKAAGSPGAVRARRSAAVSIWLNATSALRPARSCRLLIEPSVEVTTGGMRRPSASRHAVESASPSV